MAELYGIADLRAVALVPRLCLGTHRPEALLSSRVLRRRLLQTLLKQSFKAVRSQAEPGNEKELSDCRESMTPQSQLLPASRNT